MYVISSVGKALKTNAYPCGLWLRHLTVSIVQQLNLLALANFLFCTTQEAHVGVETSCQLGTVYRVFYILRNSPPCQALAWLSQNQSLQQPTAAFISQL